MDFFSQRVRLCLMVAEAMIKEKRLGNCSKRTHQNLPNNTPVVPNPMTLNLNSSPDVPESSSTRKIKLFCRESASSSRSGKKRPINRINQPPFDERREKKTVIMAGPSTPPSMPEAFGAEVRVLGGTQLKLVLQKDLKDSDVVEQQSRLSMPLKQLGSDDFLNEEEKRTVRPGDGVEVTVVYKVEASSEVQRTELRLRKWVYNSSSSYVLVHGWREVFQASMLMKGDIVQVWFFRDKNGKPCFAIVKL